MSEPVKDAFKIQQGATFVRQYRWSRDSVNVNLTGADIKSQFRSAFSSTQAVLDLTIGNGGVVIDDAVEGLFSLHASAAQTSALTGTSDRGLVMDVYVTLAGETTRLIEAVATVTPAVTR